MIASRKIADRDKLRCSDILLSCSSRYTGIFTEIERIILSVIRICGNCITVMRECEETLKYLCGKAILRSGLNLG